MKSMKSVDLSKDLTGNPQIYPQKIMDFSFMEKDEGTDLDVIRN